MSLPEPSFIDRDPAQITQELIQFYEKITGKTLQPAQVERLLIDLIAYRESLIRIAIQEAAKQNLVAFAKYPMLDYLGELVGVTRLEAQPARTTIRFTLTETQTFDVTIPAGTRIETKDGKQVFATIEAGTITAGQMSVDVVAVAETPGIDANGYLAGDISVLVDPIAYVESASNTTISYGGADAESDDRYRKRIKEAPEKFSVAGPSGAYVYWAKTAHQDIVDVSVSSPSPGVVNVYPLMGDGNPTQEILNLISTTLNNERIRPLTDQVQVLSPTRVDFDMVVEVTLYNYADATTVQEEIQKRLDDYIAFLKAKLGKDIVSNQIIALLNSVYGVYKVSLTLTEGTTQFTDRTIADNEWANCTGYTVNIVGYTNG